MIGRNRPLHTKRARLLWPLLVARATAGDNPFTYGELAPKIGIHWRVIRFALGEIQEYCGANRLPPLQAFAVNKKTKLPGTGYHGSARTKADHARAVQAVRDYGRWPMKAPF